MDKKQHLEQKIYNYLHYTAQENTSTIEDLAIILKDEKKALHVSVHKGSNWFQTDLEEILKLSPLERVFITEEKMAHKILTSLNELYEKYRTPVEIRIHFDKKFHYHAFCKLTKVEELDINQIVNAV